MINVYFVVWFLNVALFQGYSTGQPEKRRYGSFGYLGLFTMMGCAVKTIYDLVRA